MRRQRAPHARRAQSPIDFERASTPSGRTRESSRSARCSWATPPRPRPAVPWMSEARQHRRRALPGCHSLVAVQVNATASTSHAPPTTPNPTYRFCCTTSQCDASSRSFPGISSTCANVSPNVNVTNRMLRNASTGARAYRRSCLLIASGEPSPRTPDRPAPTHESDMPPRAGRRRRAAG